MSDQAETPIICGAAGDPCITEIPKLPNDDAVVKNVDCELTSLPEVCAVNSKTSPSANHEISSGKTVVRDICAASEIVSTKLFKIDSIACQRQRCSEFVEKKKSFFYSSLQKKLRLQLNRKFLCRKMDTTLRTRS